MSNRATGRRGVAAPAAADRHRVDKADLGAQQQLGATQGQQCCEHDSQRAAGGRSAHDGGNGTAQDKHERDPSQKNKPAHCHLRRNQGGARNSENRHEMAVPPTLSRNKRRQDQCNAEARQRGFGNAAPVHADSRRPTVTNSPPSGPRLLIQTELRQPGFGTPCIAGGGEKIVRSLADECTRVCPNILNAILVEPTLHLAHRVPMLFGMLILVPQPCNPPLGVGISFAQHGIQRNPAIPGHTGDESPKAKRYARECVVKADDDESTRSRQRRDAGKRCAWVGRMVQHARRVNHVECARPQSRTAQIGFDELHARKPEAPRRNLAEQQGRTCQVRANDQPISACQV